MVKYDFVILGQGSAAFAAAIRADELGIKTAMVGDGVTAGTVLGGTCVNVGCVPSKRLLNVGVELRNAFERARGTGGRRRFDLAKVMEGKDELVGALRREKYSEVLKALGNVSYYGGRGRFVSKDAIQVGRERIQGDKFLVATGARADVPPIAGIEKVNYLTNEEALGLKRAPKTMCVIGGRALGLEFAQMFALFGTKVTLLQRSGRILPEDEPEVSEALTRYMRGYGIDIYAGAKVISVGQSRRKKVVAFESGGSRRKLEVDELLMATGRRPNTESIGLDRAGVKVDDSGFVIVDETMKTSAENVWAAGDATGEPMLEPLAAKEGAVAVDNAFGRGPRKIDFMEVPSAVFTYPEVARVGLTEVEVQRRGIACGCTTVYLDKVPKARIMDDTRGLVKMVIDRRTKRILGVHMVAPHAADLIHEGVLAVKFGLTIDDIIDTVHVFPTLSEAVKLAALSFYHDVDKLSCCVQ